MAHSSTAKGRACTQECLRSTKHSVQPGVSARRRGLLLPESSREEERLKQEKGWFFY
jgi:hypothetical protein